MPVLFAACGDDDFYDDGRPGWGGNGGNGSYVPSGPLNRYEEQLVGSYMSDDDPSSVYYLSLGDDRSGNFRLVENGHTTGDSFTWGATSTQLTVVYSSTGQSETMNYRRENGHIYFGTIPYIVDDGGSSVVTSPLVGQWQGFIGNDYYRIVWGASGSDFATVCEFTANGEGVQLDYDIHHPMSSFAYSPFKWTRTDNVITITYQPDGQLSAARIADFALSSSSFTGTINYGAENFKFNYRSITGFDWTPYIYGGGQETSSAKTRARQVITMLRRADSGPVACGAFI